MVGTDAEELVVGRVGAHTAEEDTDFGLPALEIGTQDRGLVGVRQLGRLELFRPPPDAKLPSMCDPHVANPLRLTPRRDEVADVVDGQEVHGRGAPLTALAAPHAQLAGAPDADAEPREQRDGRIEDVLGEPTWTDVTRC